MNARRTSSNYSSSTRSYCKQNPVEAIDKYQVTVEHKKAPIQVETPTFRMTEAFYLYRGFVVVEPSYSIDFNASTGLILSNERSVIKFTRNANTIANPAEYT